VIRPGGALEQALLAMVTAQPKLLSDIERGLRDGGWHGFSSSDLRTFVWGLADAGRIFLRRRVHGAGAATYLASVAFETVVDGRGKTRSVSL
jgi:hypothetical protein